MPNADIASRQPDRRVRRTRVAIRRALISLIVEKGYDAVTVTDIIDRADIGRSTFYSHFTHKLDVLESGLKDITGFLDAYHGQHPDRLFSFSLPMFEHVHANRERLRALIGRRAATTVRITVERLLAERFRDDLLAALPDLSRPPAELDLLVDGITGTYLALVTGCLDGDPERTPHQLDAVFRSLVIPGVTAALSRTQPMDG